MNVDLLEGSATGGPFRVWHLIDASRRRLLTGELVLETSPRTNIYLRDGEVYFAERATDGGLGVRLLVEGVITRAQLQRGSLLVSGFEHLGRLFDRDQTVERGPVELCVELMTEELLVTVGEEWVEDFKFVPFKLHPSGIDRWMPRRVEVVYRQESDADAALVPSAADVELTEPDVTPAPQSAPPPEPAAVAEPMLAVATSTPVVPPPPVTGEHPVVLAVPLPTRENPVVPTVAEPADEPAAEETPAYRPSEAYVPLAPPPSLASPAPAQLEPDAAPNELDAAAAAEIADEIAEAVRRALASIETNITGQLPRLEDDLIDR